MNESRNLQERKCERIKELTEKEMRMHLRTYRKGNVNALKNLQKMKCE